jgi:hypothetical protein
MESRKNFPKHSNGLSTIRYSKELPKLHKRNRGHYLTLNQVDSQKYSNVYGESNAQDNLLYSFDVVLVSLESAAHSNHYPKSYDRPKFARNQAKDVQEDVNPVVHQS